MDIKTSYLGLDLRSPIVAGACPLTANPDTAKELEASGAGALVMPSLFQEEIDNARFRAEMDVVAAEETFAEATSYLPASRDYVLSIGPEPYLERLSGIKDSVKIPVVASLNGIEPDTLALYGKMCQDRGADAIELNVYFLATDSSIGPAEVDDKILRITERIKGGIDIPLAVKISPFHSSIANIAGRLISSGADAVVLFNRFYEPEIDLKSLSVMPTLRLSDSSELPLRLRWVGLLHEGFEGKLAITGGVHSGEDAAKAILAGAQTIQVVSSLLKGGPKAISEIERDLVNWLGVKGYHSLSSARGALAQSPDKHGGGYERSNYAKILKGGAKYV